MRKLSTFFLMMAAVLILAPAAFAAQAAGGATAAAQSNQAWVILTAGFSMAIASGLCGVGMGLASMGSSLGFARNPAASTVIQNMLILSLALIESLALYTFLIIFLKVKP